jgi:hypothetical protein
MKKTSLLSIVLLWAAAGASAGTIALFNTGVDGAGIPLAASGATDPHYTVTSGNTPTQQAVTFNCCYFADGPNSNWISVSTGGGDGSADYDFQTTFMIAAGFDPSTASITGLFAADNHITATKINGTVVPGATTDTFSNFTAFSVTSGFVSGLNTLDFIVHDDSPPSSLRVDNLQGTVSPISSTAPEPGSIALLLGGVTLVALRKYSSR